MPAGRWGGPDGCRDRLGRCLAMGFAVGLLVGCGGVATGPKARTRPRIEPRDTRLLHEDCAVPAAGPAAEDINGDGRPDRRTASEGPTARCRTLDFNYDGAVDAWVYLDEAGRLRRREHDYDGDGSIDEISVYQAGVLVEQHRCTSRARKLDTWHYFAAGKVARTERDSNGDDYVDQWWEYPEQRPADCPLIHSDVDGDGQPDPGATVDVCRDRFGGGPPQVEGGTAEPGAVGELPTELPTELEAGESAPPEQTSPSEPEDEK